MTKHMSWTGTHPAVDLWAEARQERDEWQARAEAAEKRIAELEALVAAQEWRTGDEIPHEEGWYQTLNWGMYGHLYFSGGRWSRYPVPPALWRPVPPTPSNSMGLTIGE